MPGCTTHVWHIGTANTILQGIQDAQWDTLQDVREMVEVMQKEIMDNQNKNKEEILTAIHTMMPQTQTQTQPSTTTIDP